MIQCLQYAELILFLTMIGTPLPDLPGLIRVSFPDDNGGVHVWIKQENTVDTFCYSNIPVDK